MVMLQNNWSREDEFAKFDTILSQYNRYIYGPAPDFIYASGDLKRLDDWRN
jgi:hypothetical protein